MLVGRSVNVAFELADLTASSSVLIHELNQPRQPILRGERRHDRGVDVLETAEADLGLAGGGELIADVDGELGDLVLDMVKDRRANVHEHAAVLEHGFDLGHGESYTSSAWAGPRVGLASNDRAAATASTWSVLSNRRARR